MPQQIIQGSEVGGQGTTAVADPTNIRRHKRAQCDSSQYRVFFTDEYLEGEGVLMDLSIQGCRVECPTDIQIGSTLALWLFLPDFDWPLQIEKAEVRWKDGNLFGLEFIRLRPAQRDRLRRLVHNSLFATPAEKSCQ